MTRKQLTRQIEALRKRYEEAFYKPLSKVIEKQISSFTEVMIRYSGRPVSTEEAARLTTEISTMATIDTDLSKVIALMYTRSGVANANLTLRYLRLLPKVQEKRGSFGFNLEWTRQILEYFEMNLFNKVVLPISATTREFILDTINRGVIEGWSIEEMVQRIEREDYLDGRVRRILRTEINRAINYGSVIGEQKWEYKTQKRWIAVHDNRTRHPHLNADGQTVMLDGIFEVGGEPMQFPGDPEASAANTVNCRCHMEMVAERDDNGRLVPKNPPAQQPRVRGQLRQSLREILADLTS
jgi:hypothetical protein